MTNTTLYPALSETGWTRSPDLIADSLFSDFYETDYSQSQLYDGAITSFSYILQKNNQDIPAILSELKIALSSLYSRYFSNVTVEVSDISDSTEPSKVTLGIYVGFSDTDGNVYTLSRSIMNVGTKTMKVFKMNNGQ